LTISFVNTYSFILIHKQMLSWRPNGN